MKPLFFLIFLFFIGWGQDEKNLDPRFNFSVNVFFKVHPNGDTLTAKTQVRNVSNDTVIIPYSTQQKFDFWLKNKSGKQIWQWSKSRDFAKRPTADTLAPGDEIKAAGVYSGRLDPGPYFLTAKVTSDSIHLENSVEMTVEKQIIKKPH